MSDCEIQLIVDIDRHADDPEKSDFNEQKIGTLNLIEGRVYIKVCDLDLGFDRYVLEELMKRERDA